MICGAPDCTQEAVAELTHNGKTKLFCDVHYELAMMVIAILGLRAETGTNPDFETVSTAMDSGRYIN